TTPLSTHSIVLAKWWGMFRLVVILLLLPAYTTVFFAIMTPTNPAMGGVATHPVTTIDRILSAVTCPLEFLVSGAVFVSLGLALPTWVRRLGRAVALSVISFFLTSIGWLFLILMGSNLLVALLPAGWQINRSRWIMNTLLQISPVFGPITPLETLSYYWQPRT